MECDTGVTTLTIRSRETIASIESFILANFPHTQTHDRENVVIFGKHIVLSGLFEEFEWHFVNLSALIITSNIHHDRFFFSAELFKTSFSRDHSKLYMSLRLLQITLNKSGVEKLI